ncbi:carboxypeptidase N subunit 2 [Acyrthosiphon pisum]|uniref:LRRCT domain-containing protein n=1 Tax=Acyrthosiphon pisum TaxID=7029 RepID=A0A8R2D1H9_ACYPI|nr:carboxypeptidase N subunit 2 [Acyrthosiphon pisum]|eukprot:XP_001943281.1 PREDICTED: carboxypeptidase N subunit 2 [Acyrthosiphon pisum]
METISKNHVSIVTGSTNMNLILCICLMIVSSTAAQTRVKCFDNNKGKDKTGIILDCSNMAGKSHPYSIEDWIRYHAFYDDGILANRVLHINLENNNLIQIFALPPMASLKKLSFKYNNISSIANKALTNLPALEELDISFNSLNSHELRESVYRSYQRPNIPATNDEPALRVLKLGYNNIHSLPPNFFQYLTKLEMLELNNNPLLVIDQNTEISLGYLTNLQVLDLANTGISDVPTDAFSQLFNVQTLYLNGNQFQNIPKGIRNMPLAYLNMNANPISNLDSESFVGLDQLQELIVSGMPNLTDVGCGTFAPLKKLITLHMSHNPKLSNIHYDAFVDNTSQQWSLRQLSISYTNISSIDSKLYPWSMLDLFDAKGNQWTCDCSLSWLASYINETFSEMPEKLLYYRCNEPKILYATLVSQLNEHIDCDNYFHVSNNHSHGHVTRLRHFIIVIGLVIGIFVFGTLINMGCREMKKVLKPSIYVPSGFSTGVKYRPADFEEDTDTLEVPAKTTTINGRSPIVINNTD